jgi:uncharacterized protein
MKKVFRIIGVVIVCFSSVPLALGWWGYRSTASFIKKADHIQAEVSSVEERPDNEGKKYCYPEFSYTDRKGDSHKIRSSTGYGGAAFVVGEKVWYFVDPENPDKARRDSFVALWLLPLIAIVSGSLVLLAGIISLVVLPVFVRDITLKQPSAGGTSLPEQGRLMDSGRQRMWTMACHLSALSWICGVPFGNIFGPLAIWLIHRDASPAVETHGRESINFQLSMMLYSVAAVCTVVGILLLPVLVIYGVVQIVRATIRANNGDGFHYPLTIRFVKETKAAH